MWSRRAWRVWYWCLPGVCVACIAGFFFFGAQALWRQQWQEAFMAFACGSLWPWFMRCASALLAAAPMSGIPALRSGVSRAAFQSLVVQRHGDTWVLYDQSSGSLQPLEEGDVLYVLAPSVKPDRPPLPLEC
jgi:hypothetical protein